MLTSKRSAGVALKVNDITVLCSALQVFRPRLVNDNFMKNLGTFLNHVKSIDSGSMQIQGATGRSKYRMLHIDQNTGSPGWIKVYSATNG